MLRECPDCRQALELHEFRSLRGGRGRRARVCEACELELRLRTIYRRRRERREWLLRCAQAARMAVLGERE